MTDQLEIGISEVHVWKYNLGNSKIIPEDIICFLSENEIQRANKFPQTPLRTRYLLVHFFVREILSRYLDKSKIELNFIQDAYGKKFLTDSNLYFNLSYRDEYALLVVSKIPKIGIDIEKIIEIDNVPEFSLDYFTTNEINVLSNVKSKQKQFTLLFKLWTIKESVIKALGVGFKDKLTSYDLSDFIDSTVNFVNFDKSIWQIHPIPIDDKHVASVAINQDKIQLSYFLFDE